MNCSSTAPTARLDAPMVMQVGALERGYTTSLLQTKYVYPVAEAVGPQHTKVNQW